MNLIDVPVPDTLSNTVVVAEIVILNIYAAIFPKFYMQIQNPYEFKKPGETVDKFRSDRIWTDISSGSL